MITLTTVNRARWYVKDSMGDLRWFHTKTEAQRFANGGCTVEKRVTVKTVEFAEALL